MNVRSERNVSVQVGSSLPSQEWHRSTELRKKGTVKGSACSRCRLPHTWWERFRALRNVCMETFAMGQRAFLTSCAERKAQGVEVHSSQPGTPIIRNKKIYFNSGVIQTRTEQQWVYVAIQTDLEEMTVTIKLNSETQIMETCSPSPIRDTSWFTGTCWLSRIYTPYIREMWC